jgi:hypothetical protein
LFLAVASALGFAFAAQAQMPGDGAPGEMNAAMLRLFEGHKGFQAKAEVKVTDADKKEVLKSPLEMALFENKTRFAIDLSQATGSSMSPETLQMLKSAGMGEMVSIARPDLKQVLMIYPVNKSIVRMPMSDKNVKAAVSDVKITKTAVGKETIDGHACVKHQVKVTDAEGNVTEATTWNAADLKDFPVQIEGKEKGMTTLLHFKEVRFTKPDASLFELPTGYKEYKNMMEMMQGMIQSMGVSAPK